MITEVNLFNFSSCYDKMAEELKTACFVSVDAEFSGLSGFKTNEKSMCDSSEERYRKLKDSSEGVLITQFGMSIFKYNREDNIYEPAIYRFYICPLPFPDCDKVIMFQASSLHFLCDANFNFNKFAYNGLPFTNGKEKQILDELLKNNMLFPYLMQTLNYSQLDKIKNTCDLISDWVLNASVDDVMTVSCGLCTPNNRLIALSSLHMIRQRFVSVWAVLEANEIKVQKVSQETRMAYMKDASEKKEIEKSLVELCCGFSRVFDLVIASKVPLVGHNMLMDLITMYSQFHNPLPTEYKNFKNGLLQLFPQIYDTKLIGSSVQKILPQLRKFNGTSLGSMFDYLKKREFMSIISDYRQYVVYNVNESSQQFHDSAFDSFATGFCFVKLAHFLAARQLFSDRAPTALSPTDHFKFVGPYKNRINVARANVSCIYLEGIDPVASRQLLLVSDKTKPIIDVNELQSRLARYGDMEAIVQSSNLVTLIVPTHRLAEVIVRKLKDDPQFHVHYSKCSVSTPASKFFIWGSIVSSFIALVTFILSRTKK